MRAAATVARGLETAVARLKESNVQNLAFARSLERYVAAFCVAHARQPSDICRTVQAEE